MPIHCDDRRVLIIEKALRRAGQPEAEAKKLAFIAYSAFESWALGLTVGEEIENACRDTEKSIWGSKYSPNAPTFIQVNNRIYRLDGLVKDVLRRMEMTQPGAV